MHTRLTHVSHMRANKTKVENFLGHVMLDREWGQSKKLDTLEV